MNNMTINIQKTLPKNHLYKEILVKARKALTLAMREDLDKNRPSYIYFDQPTVSDLIVVEYSIKDSKFKFRKCTDREWVKYYNNFLK